jgi:hypothetical protein
VQCSIGFGKALIALPVLAFIDPVFAPGPLMIGGALSGALVLLRDRSALHVEGVAFAWPGQLAGIGIAALLLQWFPLERMDLLLGITLLAAVLLTGGGLHVEITRRALVVTGVLSGFMGMLSALAGAPLGILYQKETGPRLRSTLSGLLFIGSLSVVVSLWVTGRLGRDEWQATLLLLPGTLLGFAISYRVAPFLDIGYTRRAVLAFAGLGGLALIVRALTH